MIVDINKNTQTTARSRALLLMLIVPYSSLVCLAVHRNLTKLQTHTNNRQTGRAKHTAVNDSIPRVCLFLNYFLI